MHTVNNCLRPVLIYCCVFFIPVTCIFAQPQTEPPLYQQTSEVNNIMVQYNADYGNLSRFYIIQNSPERRSRLLATVNEYIGKLGQLDFEKLNTGTKVDYILFNRDLHEQLYQLQTEAKEYDSTKQWLPFADSIYAYEKLRRRGTVLNAQQFASDLTNWSNQIKALQKKLAQQSSIPFNLGERARGTIDGLQDALKSIYKFYNGYDPMFTWWIPQPYRITDSLLTVYADLIKTKQKSIALQKKDSSGIKGNPIGIDELKRRLQYELVDYTPDELLTIAEKEYAWCRKEMLKASNEMGFGNNWKAALEKVKISYVPPGEQPTAMLKLYNESVDFIKQHDLITLPPLAEETWRMNMMSPAAQRVNPFFLGGEEFIISYPTDSMSEEDKMMSMRGNNPHFSRATVHHELLAGHALQQFMSGRYKTYRQFYTSFWIEGWSLYWEMLLWDLNFPQSPEDRVGMLFWRMHRCARIIFSINYHTGKWSPQQCIDFLVDSVGHERANAEGEVRRSFEGGYDPLYQIGYMIGGLQIMQLKRELVDSKKMSYKDFHDAFIQQNAMPIEMERVMLENLPLTKDYKAGWKFYEK
ncbi:MAG TPA: DUF885 family protein [Parafilimonas sp.]|nr:DUF885 family protein [Parafilimonas sp.]